MIDDMQLTEAVNRLRFNAEFADTPSPLMDADLEFVLNVLARYHYGPPWLSRLWNGKIAVKYRDAECVLQDQEFDTEESARIYAARLNVLDAPLEWRGDLITSLKEGTWEETRWEPDGTKTVTYGPNHPRHGTQKEDPDRHN